LGVAAGFWWADAVAALIISLEIIRSGWSEVKTSVTDLMDRRPQKLGGEEFDPLPEKITRFLLDQEWISEAVARIREKGRELVVEAYVIPCRDSVALEEIDRTAQDARKLDIRIHNVALVATRRFSEELQAVKATVADREKQR
jgi:divalent metal cation (Fe/Co/Zn/Cd) transporter